MAPYFSKQDMSDLLVTAWEGGSTYWVDQAEYVPPEGMTKKQLRKTAWEAAPPEAKELWKDEGPEGRWPLYSMLPYLPPSVKWKIRLTHGSESGEAEKVYLTPENMREASTKLIDKHPHIFARIKDGNYDAGDADVWLQMAALGEEVYG